MTKITASCHCGAVAITAELKGAPNNPARCSCSFCARRQAGNVSAPTASVKVVKGAENLSRYSWGTHTAQHYFCKTCGIYVYHQRRSDPAECGINIGCIEGEKPWEYEPMHWNDGRDHPSDRS